jgi:hypothetical protein
MLPVKFRIGTKLAITAGAGLVMVAAIVANEMWDRTTRAALAAEAKNAATVLSSVRPTSQFFRSASTLSESTA